MAARIYVNQELPHITSVERNNEGKAPPYVSPTLAWDAFREAPALLTATPAQTVARARALAATSEHIEETVDALYLQTEMRLLKNRLNLLTGVRYEKTTDEGEGPLLDPDGPFRRNPDGSFVREGGNRVRHPEAGAVGSLEEVAFTHRRRGYGAKRSYDGYYPSVHLTCNLGENFLARLAYAKTYGRPNHNEIIPNATIDENELGNEDDPNAIRGTINVRNTGLRPWSAHNYDLSLEYYTGSGGLFGASVFHKDLADFFGTFARVATAADLPALGLDSRYVGWQVNSRINSGDAAIAGFELSANHSLSPLGKLGKHFRAFANFTQLELEGDRDADFSGFLPRTVNWGVTFSRKPFILMAKWNYRETQRTTPAPAFGPDGYNYVDGRINLDLNLDWQIRKFATLYINVRNVYNDPNLVNLRYGSETPDYARTASIRNYGAALNAGIKGSF